MKNSIGIKITERTGYIACGICKARVVSGVHTFGFFCPNAECANSERAFLANE